MFYSMYTESPIIFIHEIIFVSLIIFILLLLFCICLKNIANIIVFFGSEMEKKEDNNKIL